MTESTVENNYVGMFLDGEMVATFPSYGDMVTAMTTGLLAQKAMEALDECRLFIRCPLCLVNPGDNHVEDCPLGAWEKANG